MPSISPVSCVPLPPLSSLYGQREVAQAKHTATRLSPQAEAKFDAAARDFEAMFISEMMKPMMETVPVDDVFGGGHGEDVFRGFLTQEYGKKMAGIGGIGLAQHIKEELIKAQGEKNMPQSAGKVGMQ